MAIIDYLIEGSLSTDRDAQIDKIKHYRDSDEFTNVCHAWTGKVIAHRNNPSDKIVLCGMDKSKIFHSFLVDKDGNNLVPDKSGYINPDIDMGAKSCKVKTTKGNVFDYPYVEVIDVDDLDNN